MAEKLMKLPLDELQDIFEKNAQEAEKEILPLNLIDAKPAKIVLPALPQQ